MKVFTVLRCDYCDCEIVGVFSTEESANTEAARLKAQSDADRASRDAPPSTCDWIVEAHEVRT